MSLLGGTTRAAGTVTTRGPGKRDSSPRPKARRFSATFSLTLAVVLSAVTAFDVVIKRSPLICPTLVCRTLGLPDLSKFVILSAAKDLLLTRRSLSPRLRQSTPVFPSAPCG